MERKIIHIDMDAFYASVEQRDNPELRGIPLAVGHAEERGVVAAASYEARKFGVRSAMSSQRAKRLCPQLTFVSGRMDVYKAVSRQIHEIFHEYTDIIEPLSLDEAFLDVTENKQNIPLAVDIAKAIKQKKSPALFHVDAVQGFGKMAIYPNKSGIDLLTISGHKIHAPKGIGALYISKDIRIPPRTFGGGQENGIRPGTEALPLISGFGEAVMQLPNISEEIKRIQTLYDSCKEQLLQLPGIVINSPEQGLPYVLNFSTCSVRSETMLHFLASKHIFVSGGSACAKGKRSHVLTAMGLDRARIQTAIRVSFSRENTQQDVNVFIEAVKDGLSSLATGK